MKRNNPPLWLCALLLGMAILWRILGAPVTQEDWKNIETPLWQARILLPQRAEKILMLWLDAAVPAAHSTTDPSAEDTNVLVYLCDENRIETMALESYVCGVVAAEMPAAYHLEALKAQAAAARTRVMQQLQNGGCSLHSGADICTDSAHCQGYASASQCIRRWGDSSSAYRERIQQAVQATKGQILTYDGEPITVLYHAISGGQTEDAATVFSQSVPYLVSVSSPGEESAQGFRQEASFTFDEIARLVSPLLPDISLSGEDVRRTLSIGSYTDSGRVKTILLGSGRIDASDFRKALGLRSTWFTLSTDAQGVTFSQRGYGHGVGMSQAGANAMAADGATWQDILAHYYPGTLLQTYDSPSAGTGYGRRDANESARMGPKSLRQL